MKSKVKIIINKFFSLFATKKNKKIISKLNKYEYVSFDVFDTLIKRNVNEEKDIFKIVEKKYDEIYNTKSNFYKNRIEAETLSRNIKKGNEITLEDIYSNIIYEKDVSDELKTMEIKTELEYCVRNSDFYEIYNYCVENKKHIFIISDMYLSKTIIEEILKKNGYKIFDDIFVSSEYNLKKSNGKIFDFILNEKNILSKKITHIGDNPIADYIMPKLKGINAILIKHKIKNNQFYGNKLCYSDLTYNIMMSSINNLNGISERYIENQGICILTPLLYSFCLGLHNYLKKNKIEKIFFLARDAKVIFDVYLKMYPEDTNISYYINISRKSVTFASFSNNITLEEFELVADSIIKRKKVYEIINILELDIEKYKDELMINCIDVNSEYEKLNIKYKKIFWNIVKNDFQKFCDQQRKLFKKFLILNNFMGNICIVDIGWKGTIQNKIDAFCKNNNISTKVYGYYMGIYKRTKNKEGFIYNGNEKNKYMIYSSVGFFELLFLNNEGTTLYYQQYDETVVPVKGKYEQEKGIIESIKYIQENAIKIIDNVYKLNLNLNSDNSFYNYKKIAVSPNLLFVKKIKNLKFNDGETYYLIDNKSLFYYFTHLHKFKNDVMNSYYKIGFLKNLIKINLPFNWILEKLYKKVKGE